MAAMACFGRWLLATSLCVLNCPVQAGNSTKPNIVFMLVDDLGWNDVSYHADGAGPTPPKTPVFDELVANGIELTRAYSYAWCAPARAALLSGRMAVHVDVNHTNSMAFDPTNPVSGSSGIPSGMTVMGGKLKGAGYKTHYNGKWGVGFAWKTQMPVSRGFDSFLGYVHDSTDYYDSTLKTESIEVPSGCELANISGIVDLIKDDGPAIGLNGTKWVDYLFLEESLKNIEDHDVSTPLFLFHAFHSVHAPLNPPEELEQPYETLKDPTRRAYHAMTTFVDTAVGKIVAKLKQKGMWENTLLVLSSDNGGPLYPGKNIKLFGGGSNHPLRGGKTSDFEGGVRVVSFVSGGLIPQFKRGTKLNDYISLSDWYGTFSSIAGVPMEDELAASHNPPLPPVDSVDVWPLLSGQIPEGSGKRTEIHISSVTLIQGKWKLLTGMDPSSINEKAASHPHVVPFDTYKPGWGVFALENGRGVSKPPYGLNCENGCLFDILNDPTESQDVAEENADVVSSMWNRLDELNKGIFNPSRGEPHIELCHDFQKTGFYAPFATEGPPKTATVYA